MASLAKGLQAIVGKGLAAQHLGDIAGEVLAVAMGLEADDIAGKQAAGEALVMRHGGEHLGRREGDVKEEADRPGGLALAQRRRKRDQMIVMDPYAVLRLDQPAQLVRDPVIGREVGVLLRLVDLNEIKAVVEERPQAAVGKAEIVELVLLWREIHRGGGDAAIEAALMRRSGASLTRPLQPNHRPPLAFRASPTATARPPL